MVGIIIAIPVLFIAVVLVWGLISDAIDKNERRLDLPPEQLTVHESGAFLDDRYAAGSRELEVPIFSDVLGLSSDGESLAVYSMVDVGFRYSGNQLALYDVASGDEIYLVHGNVCSNVTPNDTVFCTLFVDLDEWGEQARVLLEIDLFTADTLRVFGLPDIGTSALEFLGESSTGEQILYIHSEEAGVPASHDLLAVPAQGEEFSWVSNYGGDELYLVNCGLFDEGSAVACAALTSEDDNPVSERVRGFDASDGSENFSDLVSDAVVFGTDGWFVPTTSGLSGGVSVEGSGATFGHTIYDYHGNIVDEVADDGGRGAMIVPNPHDVQRQQITYPSTALITGSSLDHYAINAEGEIVAEGMWSTRQPRGSGERTYERVSDGGTIAHGVARSVSANGGVLLMQEEYSTDVAQLIDVHSGEVLRDITASGHDSTIRVVESIISYPISAETLVVLLPGE